MRATLELGEADRVGAHIGVSAGAPALPTPFRLALYYVRKDFPAQGTMRKAEWLGTDKQALIAALAPIHGEGIITELIQLEDDTIHGRMVERIRHAAQRRGADAVLIVDGVAAVDRYNTRSAWLYATLIGAYLASGTESEALFIVDGTLWDVRTGRLLFREAAEGTFKRTGPAMSVEDRHVLDQAKQAAVDQFSKRLVERIRGLKATGPPSDRVSH